MTTFISCTHCTNVHISKSMSQYQHKLKRFFLFAFNDCRFYHRKGHGKNACERTSDDVRDGPNCLLLMLALALYLFLSIFVFACVSLSHMFSYEYENHAHTWDLLILSTGIELRDRWRRKYQHRLFRIAWLSIYIYTHTCVSCAPCVRVRFLCVCCWIVSNNVCHSFTFPSFERRTQSRAPNFSFFLQKRRNWTWQMNKYRTRARWVLSIDPPNAIYFVHICIWSVCVCVCRWKWVYTPDTMRE